MDLGLQGKRAIVTGGSLGIGKAIAREPGPGGVRAGGAVGRAPARCRERALNETASRWRNSDDVGSAVRRPYRRCSCGPSGPGAASTVLDVPKREGYDAGAYL